MTTEQPVDDLQKTLPGKVTLTDAELDEAREAAKEIAATRRSGPTLPQSLIDRIGKELIADDESREAARQLHQQADDVFEEVEPQPDRLTNDRVDLLFIAYAGRPDEEPMDQVTAALLTIADILARQLPK